MKRPAVEEFKRLTTQPASAWGMADSDVGELCDYILHLETAAAEQHDQLRDCEFSLNIFDEGRTSEYWLRHSVQPSNE
jgi:hypothetical protein